MRDVTELPAAAADVFGVIRGIVFKLQLRLSLQAVLAVNLEAALQRAAALLLVPL